MVDTTKGNKKDVDSEIDFDNFSEEYMSSVQEQMKKFTENPEMLQKALAPFMKLQRDYIEHPEKLSSLTEGGKTDTDEILDILKRIRARLVKLEKRLEEAGVIKPAE